MKIRKRIAVILILLLICPGGLASADGGEAPESLTLEGTATLALPDDCSRLQTVTLIDCHAADLTPLIACKRLTAVTIVRSDGYQGTGAYDLTPLTQCTRLTTLTLEGTCTEDYTPVTSLTLKHLSLSGAGSGQIAAIFTAIGRRLESAVVGDCTLTDEANAAILQTTKLTSLRFANVDGIDTSADAWTKLSNLSALQMTGCTLDSLDFLSNFVASVIIKLDDVTVDGAVCSVAFDKYFLQCGNVPSDALLDFLGGSGRQWLYATVAMQSGAVSSAVIEAFADIGSLLSLDVQAVAADAWSADVWKGFPKLEQLKLSGSGTADLGFLAQLPVLERLAISDTTVTNSGAIGDLPLLTQLTLISCELDGWDFLNELTSLELLTAADCNGPTSLDFVKHMKHLQSLALENAPVTDLSPLTGHVLEALYLYGCPIADYAPLATLSRLTLLSCNADATLPSLSCRVVHRHYIELSE